MKVVSYPILACVILPLTGCSANSLADRLKDRGVTPGTTAKLKFVGTEADFGPDVHVTIEDPEVIESVWIRIHSATPTEHWAASGFRKIEFYTSKKAKWVDATLMLNVTDAAFLDTEFWHQFDSDRKGYYGLMRCPGLHKLVMRHLREEHERRKNSS
ncbi:MAG: hypothetical protein ISS79_05670 [Phycisphaerae bacterium]|nr:hypothetical protein [Phycisphaerae bacterium]